MKNLANDLAFKDKLEDLRYRMMTMLKEEEDPRALGHFEIFDTYTYQGGRQKGYETWLKAQEASTLAELKKKLEEPKVGGKKAKKNKGKEENN